MKDHIDAEEKVTRNAIQEFKDRMECISRSMHMPAPAMPITDAEVADTLYALIREVEGLRKEIKKSKESKGAKNDGRDLNDEDLLEENGWTIDCESPFEISHADGSRATGLAAMSVVELLRLQYDEDTDS